jgi:tRNA pseudouridine32 synthase / 23S rRNA pseudouridine746 synthase
VSRPRPSPLPVRDTVAPSYAWLPQGEWPHLFAWLLQRFPHVGEDVLRQRLERGEIVDEEGRALTAMSPYRAGARIWYYREVPDEPRVPFDAVVLHRDEHLLVVDKPHFLATVPGGRHLRETLLSRLRHELDLPELTPIHRLDRETAGIVLFCLHAPSRGAYQQLFAERIVEKTYEAIAPFRADLVLPCVHKSRLAESSGDGQRFFTMQEVPGVANSETRIDLLERRGEQARYRLRPRTGRKHQLRVHMAALGIPICNDPWYPVVQADQDDFAHALQLLAREIAFTDPLTGQPRQFRSQRELGW